MDCITLQRGHETASLYALNINAIMAIFKGNYSVEGHVLCATPDVLAAPIFLQERKAQYRVSNILVEDSLHASER